jgi:hypothetical protein
MIDGFKRNVESALKSFDGFSVSVKDEEVEIPLSYAVSDEERNVVASQLEDLLIRTLTLMQYLLKGG